MQTKLFSIYLKHTEVHNFFVPLWLQLWLAVCNVLFHNSQILPRFSLHWSLKIVCPHFCVCELSQEISFDSLDTTIFQRNFQCQYHPWQNFSIHEISVKFQEINTYNEIWRTPFTLLLHSTVLLTLLHSSHIYIQTNMQLHYMHNFNTYHSTITSYTHLFNGSNQCFRYAKMGILLLQNKFKWKC